MKSLINKFNLPCLSLLMYMMLTLNTSYSQNFIKITTGDIVNVPGDSWGCSWTDYDNDGKLDLFIANAVNDFLYKGTGDSIFIKITTGQIINDSLDTRGSAWGDYDNDGDEDLFISIGAGNNILYRNDGNGNLTKITTGIIVNDGGTSRGCAWGDYDNDGKLDLYVANVGDDFLYHNDGNGSFTKITTGAIVTSGGSTIGCNWIDYNNDGYLDLYAVNFNGLPSFLFKNNGNGTFTQITTGSIVNDVAPSTGGNWGDYDNDGDMDLFTAIASNVKSFFYRNDGPPNFTFTKDTITILSNDPGDTYAGSWVDYDNDGDLDLFAANRSAQNEFLYNNNGYPSYTFTKITAGALVNDAGWSYGSAWADYDNDGDVDVFICNKSGDKNSLFENTGNVNGWVSIKCKGVSSNYSAIGTRLKVKATINGIPIWQTHEITSQSGYYSHNSLIAEFGFGNATVIDSLTIKWPGSQTETYTNLALNKSYSATQGVGLVGINNRNGVVTSDYTLDQNFPNPFNPETKITFSLPQREKVNLSVYDIKGTRISVLVDDVLNRGSYTVNFNSGNINNIPSGVYFYVLMNDKFRETRKMILVK